MLKKTNNITAKITLHTNYAVYKTNSNNMRTFKSKNNDLSSLSPKILLVSGLIVTGYVINHITDKSTRANHVIRKYTDKVCSFRREYCRSASLLGSTMLRVAFPYFYRNNDGR